MKTVKEMTEENIKLLEARVTELENLKHTIDVGIANLKDTIQQDKKYLATIQ